jgi:hypothetical protein
VFEYSIKLQGELKVESNRARTNFYRSTSVEMSDTGKYKLATAGNRNNVTPLDGTIVADYTSFWAIANKF